MSKSEPGLERVPGQKSREFLLAGYSRVLEGVILSGFSLDFPFEYFCKSEEEKVLNHKVTTTGIWKRTIHLVGRHFCLR